MTPAVDRISDLPENVTNAILIRLPIRDAVRTSILSRYWRYQWCTLPQLVFDDEYTSLPKGSAKTILDRKRVEIYDQVLLLHRGPIHKFKLSNNLPRTGHIDRWILFLSRNGIKEFTLDKLTGLHYKVPSCLYLCEGITYLELRSCTIALPASFKGFRHLKTLDLTLVKFSDNGLETLVTACPLMEKLGLRHIDGCDHLKICAPKLVDLDLVVQFEDFCFESTPLLAALKIHHNIRWFQVPLDGLGTLVHIFGSLPRIKRLGLWGMTLKALAGIGDTPIVKLPTAYQLKYLDIHLDFGDMTQLSAALCMFRSTPILQTLRIEAFSVHHEHTDTISNEDFWATKYFWGVQDFDCLLNRLKIIEVINFTGSRSELKFVELLLAYAPILQKVQIVLKEKVDGALNILTKLTQFPRVSPDAKLYFKKFSE